MSFLDEILDTGSVHSKVLNRPRSNNLVNNEDHVFRKPFVPPVRRVAPSITGMNNFQQITPENNEQNSNVLFDKFMDDIKQHFSVLPLDTMMKLHYHYIERANHELINDRKKRNAEGSSNGPSLACERCNINGGQQLGFRGFNAPSMSSREHLRSVINSVRNFETGPVSLRNFGADPGSLRGEIVNYGKNNNYLAQEYTRCINNAPSVSRPMSLRGLINTERIRGVQPSSNPAIPRRGDINIPGSILEVEAAECEEENAGIYMPTTTKNNRSDVERIFQWTLLLINDEDVAGLAIAGKLERGCRKISHVSSRIIKVELDNVLVTETKKYSPADESTLIGIPKEISDRYMKTGRFPKKFWLKMTKEWSELETTREKNKLETTEKRSRRGRLLKRTNVDTPKYTSSRNHTLTDDSTEQTDSSTPSLFKRKRKVVVKKKTNEGRKINETMTTRSKSRLESSITKQNAIVKPKGEPKKKAQKEKGKVPHANKRQKVDNSKESTKVDSPKESIKVSKKSRVVANLDMNKKKEEELSNQGLLNEIDELFGNVSAIDQISLNVLSPGAELKNMTKGSILTLNSETNIDDDDMARVHAPNVTSLSGISAFSTPLSKTTVKCALENRLKKPSQIHIIKDKFKKKLTSMKADQERANRSPVRFNESESEVSDFEDVFHDEPEESTEY